MFYHKLTAYVKEKVPSIRLETLNQLTSLVASLIAILGALLAMGAAHR